MDWFSWLSKSGLEPSLIYEYGVAFARNELQQEDVSYFNHEFLQSMGISVAKHRLEILKLARKENRVGPGTLSGLILAINKTKKCLNKCINKLVFRDDVSFKAAPEMIHYREHWRGGLLRRHKSEDVKEDDHKPVLTKRSITLSGPLDGRVQEKVMVNTRSLKLSGPLDGRQQERIMYTARSPRLSGPLDRRVQERMGYTAKNTRLPGPIDGWVPERSIITTKSPMLSGHVTEGRMQERLMVRSPGPPDGRVSSPMVSSKYNQEKVDVDYDDHSLWATLFHDMKPT
ncbi:hypothetical protein I3843_03G235100 [Carya illinoinensis]|uniref:uncharacterized protein LOC122305220 n=1 Tax=Carya illinoinensis TaxID=32201 RepID=UPI001BF21F4E|nr:uncharacterized protein LOC122305220 [Carya illinoinensis]KAG2718938.1 hypothetical protein I3760_03G243500 [Carya illinoinensis]KAG7989383.1 hypothetical protein I3843_03G235100 [Carya illinoinensis]